MYGVRADYPTECREWTCESLGSVFLSNLRGIDGFQTCVAIRGAINCYPLRVRDRPPLFYFLSSKHKVPAGCDSKTNFFCVVCVERSCGGIELHVGHHSFCSVDLTPEFSKEKKVTKDG